MSVKRFSRLLFPVMDIKNEDMLQAFPELAKHEAFADYHSRDRNRWIRYVVLLYDQNSELIREHEDLRDRRMAVLEIAELSPEHDRVKKVLNCELKSIKTGKDGKQVVEENKDVIAIYEMIKTYICKIQHNLKWKELCALEAYHEELVYEQLIRVQDYKDDNSKLQALERKSKMFDLSRKAVGHITQLRKELFHGDEEAEAFIYERVATPEAIARQ